MQNENSQDSIVMKYAVITNQNDTCVAVRIGSPSYANRQRGYDVAYFETYAEAFAQAKLWNQWRREGKR